MTAVIYARYSSDSQREASIEGQLRDCKDYAEKNRRGDRATNQYSDRAGYEWSAGIKRNA